MASPHKAASEFQRARAHMGFETLRVKNRLSSIFPMDILIFEMALARK